MKNIRPFLSIFFVIVFFISGCSPVMLRNAETGAIAQCRQEGLFPIINQLRCVSSYKNQGWIQTTHEKEQLQGSLAEETKLCWKQIESHPQLNIIANKVAIGGLDTETFSMLTNTSKPTEAEKVAISIYADLRKNCIKEYDKALIHTPLAIKLVYSSARIAWDNLLVMLYSGNLTYGEFTKANKEVNQVRSSALVEIYKELRTNAANANARAEKIAIQRQNTFNNAFSAMQNSRKTTADPLKFQQRQKASFKCTSRKSGYSVHTDCNERSVAPALNFNLGK